MNVYILNASAYDTCQTLGAFTSYSAMLCWLKHKHNYSSKTTKHSTPTKGQFISTVNLGGVGWFLSYDSYVLISEHSVKTNRVEFK